METKTQSLTDSRQHSPAKISNDGINQSVQVSGSTAAEMVAEQTRAEVQGAMTLAKKFPRDEEQARKSIVASCQSIKFAERAVYKKPVGKIKVGNNWVQNYVEGPTIRFAEEMLRHWGNVKTQEFIIYEDFERRLVRVVSSDLQSNTSYSEDIIVEKTVERKNPVGREVVRERLNSSGEKVSIVLATEDEIRNKEKALVSKAIRNNGLRLIPAHIVEEAIDYAKGIILSGVGKNVDDAIRKMKESFVDLGITVEDIEKYLKHPISKITTEDILELKKVHRAIKDGEAKWNDYVPDDSPVDPPSKGFSNVESKTVSAKTWDELEANLSAGNPETHTDVKDRQVTK